ncbi:sensor histidine kinase [Streptomyces vinaceus]|uniref:sensor histidine kinase n=1 Tax=Streptomyces vinaceus TaxID=1960 RepID=UPI0037FEDD07
MTTAKPLPRQRLPRLRRQLSWLILGVAGPAAECAIAAGVADFTGPYGMLRAAALMGTPLVLLAAHRRPLPVFLATLVCLGAGPMIGPLPALYAVARHHRRRWVPIACAVLFLGAAQLVFHPAAREVSVAAFSRTTALAMICMVPVVLGILARTRQELAARLTDLHEARDREHGLLTEQVLATERARLAREMHDIIAHQVSLISVQAAALQVTTTDPRARDSSRTIRELSSTTLEELRQMLGVLRASGGTIDVHAPQPRLADLPQLVTDSGLDVDLRIEVPLAGPAASTWSPTVQRTVFRTVQEGLTNASKHAPGAPIEVRLYAADDHLHVEVRNGPSGPGAVHAGLPESGYGLTGLKERAQLAHGTLRTGVTDDGGHLLHAAYPSSSVPDPRAPAPVPTPTGYGPRGSASPRRRPA